MTRTVERHVAMQWSRQWGRVHLEDLFVGLGNFPIVFISKLPPPPAASGDCVF